jgi:cell division protein FtsB
MIPGLSTLAAKIATGAAVALALALAVVMWRADAISAQRDDLRADLATCEARHAVTRQSVATLELSLGRYVGAGKAARVAQLAAIEAQADDNARLEAQAAAIRAEMAAMEPGPGCETPDSIRNAEGL